MGRPNSGRLTATAASTRSLGTWSEFCKLVSLVATLRDELRPRVQQARLVLRPRAKGLRLKPTREQRLRALELERRRGGCAYRRIGCCCCCRCGRDSREGNEKGACLASEFLPARTFLTQPPDGITTTMSAQRSRRGCSTTVDERPVRGRHLYCVAILYGDLLIYTAHRDTTGWMIRTRTRLYDTHSHGHNYRQMLCT